MTTETNDLDTISGVLCRAMQLSEGEHYRIAVEATNALDRIKQLVTPQTNARQKKTGAQMLKDVQVRIDKGQIPHPRGHYGQLQDDLKKSNGDIVKELRLRAAYLTLDPESASMMRKASDEIERLRNV